MDDRTPLGWIRQLISFEFFYALGVSTHALYSKRNSAHVPFDIPMWLTRVFGRLPLAAHLQVGRTGEDVAAHYLSAQGYRVLHRNVRLGKDEIDIIAHDPEDDVMVFAEVKTRSRLSDDFHPELNMRYEKRQKLQRSARRWVAEHDLECGYRIDLLCVAEGKVIDHIKELSWEE